MTRLEKLEHLAKIAEELRVYMGDRDLLDCVQSNAPCNSCHYCDFNNAVAAVQPVALVLSIKKQPEPDCKYYELLIEWDMDGEYGSTEGWYRWYQHNGGYLPMMPPEFMEKHVWMLDPIKNILERWIRSINPTGTAMEFRAPIYELESTS